MPALYLHIPARRLLRTCALSALLLFSTHFSYAEVSTSDPLWDWKYDAIERLSLAFGERTVSNSRPYSRFEMADLVLRLAAKAGAENNYYRVLLERLKEDLEEEIKSINERASSDLKIKAVRWIRAKAVHSSDPFRLENDYGFNARDLSIRGELSTSGTWDFFGYELRPEYNMLRDDEAEDEDKLDLHSGYIVLWLKNLEIAVGKNALWWGPGRRGSWVLTNNAPSFELIKISNAVEAVPPGPFKVMGSGRVTAFIGRLSEQRIVYQDRGATVEERKRPLFAGLRLDFSPSRCIEIGASQGVEFIDRGGRGYSLDYLSKTFFASWESNEEEAIKGPVANRVTSFDISLNIDRKHDFMKVVGLKGIKFYWETGGETMASDKRTKLPRTSNTANIFGIYLDSGKTDFRVEYASNYDTQAKWYDHYQFTEGYRNDGFVLGNHMGGNARDLYVSLTHPITEGLSADIYFERKEQETERGDISREDTVGVSVDAFLGSRKAKISYEYRDGDNPENVNQVWIAEGVYKF